MNTLQLDIDLTDGQLRKFKSFFNSMIIVDHRSYFSTSEMHGVLLTQSKEKAKHKLKNQESYVNQYLLNIDDETYIKLIGVDILLDRLCEIDPRKQHQYLASKAIINTWAANNPEIFRDGQIRANKEEREKIKAMHWMRKKASHCLLSGMQKPDVKLEIHHILGVAETPELAADVENLIPLSREVHQEYHSWATREEVAVTRASLKKFALIHGYNTDWSWLSNISAP